MAWVSTSATAFNTPDVGEIMPVVGSTAVQALGEVRFNDSGALANCPAVPTEAESTTDKMLTNEVNEVARSKEGSDAANHMKHR
jgi:hypothetical protein